MCPIGWQPGALTPVFYGVRDLSPADGAPVPLRVFFPSLDGSVFSAPILEGCGRYPVILFAHGACPTDVEHYKKWFHLPAELARGGYVVVVPELAHTARGGHPATDPHPDLATLAAILTWVRGQWEHRGTLLPEPATGICGHSYGAVLSARFAADNPQSFAGYASLSGVHTDWPTPPLPIQRLGLPMQFIMGGQSDSFTDLGGSLWEGLARPRHRAVFANGFHWDYLQWAQTPCDPNRGPCPYIGAAAADLVGMFFAKYLPLELLPGLPAQIPDSLTPPDMVLTPEQEFFAGGHLVGYKLLGGKPECAVAQDWATLNDRIVPWVQFLPLAVAAKDVKDAGLIPKFTGGGGPGTPWVASQSPFGGAVVTVGSVVSMFLRNGPIP
jgi:pimeloyl-ACP methyl ester carboxylesterase